jgi:hypothetical protein
MRFIIGLIVGCIVGFFGCAVFAANKITRADKLLEAAQYIKKQWLNFNGNPYDVLPLIRAIDDCEGKEEK